jgi:pimeloyl-ACP methyl ester carboxylesterase
MSRKSRTHPAGRVRWTDHAVSALNGWIGDYLARTGNGLEQIMAFYDANRPVDPTAIRPSADGKVCVLVHGLGCNESLWRFPGSGDDYGRLLQDRHGHLPLYVRFNTGRHVSDNGARLASLLERLRQSAHPEITDIVLIGHSQGGLVIRSACHQGAELGHGWTAQVRHVVYLGTPHLGAPLEQTAARTARILGRIDTTATRVIKDVIDSRPAGVKDLRHGSLVDEDHAQDTTGPGSEDRCHPVPWLATARHHLVIGQALPGDLGDALVSPASAAARSSGGRPGPPEGTDTHVMPGLNHLALARHPAVFEHIDRWVGCDGS